MFGGAHSSSSSSGRFSAFDLEQAVARGIYDAAVDYAARGGICNGYSPVGEGH